MIGQGIREMVGEQWGVRAEAVRGQVLFYKTR